MEKEKKISTEKLPKGDPGGGSMSHKHFWILDKNSFGRCRDCPATKQFPAGSKLKLRPSEISAIEGLDSIYSPDDWLHESSTSLEVGI